MKIARDPRRNLIEERRQTPALEHSREVALVLTLPEKPRHQSRLPHSGLTDDYHCGSVAAEKFCKGRFDSTRHVILVTCRFLLLGNRLDVGSAVFGNLRPKLGGREGNWVGRLY